MIYLGFSDMSIPMMGANTQNGGKQMDPVQRAAARKQQLKQDVKLGKFSNTLQKDTFERTEVIGSNG